MLDVRLQAIYDLIKENSAVADIGTDHAFLPIELLKNKKCLKVYACDVNDGPLKIARENIKANGFEKSIITIKSDGLKNVPDDTEVIVIAGMGYYTARDILEKAKDKLGKYKQIIVQVNTDVNLFRKWLSDNHFKIVNEKMVKVKHFYTIIEFNTEKGEELSEEDLVLGPVLRKEKSEVFLEFVNYKLAKLLEIKSGLNSENEIINKEIEIFKKGL